MEVEDAAGAGYSLRPADTSLCLLATRGARTLARRAGLEQSESPARGSLVVRGQTTKDSGGQRGIQKKCNARIQKGRIDGKVLALLHFPIHVVRPSRIPSRSYRITLSCEIMA